MNKDHWQKMYELPLKKIPWEIAKIPEEIRYWIVHEDMFPGQSVLDIGCGTGNYAIWLAKNSIDVTGIDISSNAIKIAKRKKSKVNFICTDIFSWKTEKQFDFIFEYSIFHHIPLKNRKRYAKKISSLLKDGGKFGMVCYSDNDPAARGKRWRIGDYGNKIYHPARREIEDIFKKYFKLLEYKPARLGRKLHHEAHCFLWKKF